MGRRLSRSGSGFAKALYAQPGPRLGAPLSARQQEILALIAAGKSNKEIANLLGLATGTVKQHAYALFRKLGVRNRTMAAARGTHMLPSEEGRAPEASAEERAGATAHAPAAEVRYARRLVTAVVLEPRPGAARTSREAMQSEKRIGALRARFGRLALAFDAVPELLSGGGVAAWFGQPVAHGDDAERAVAFVRALGRGAQSDDDMPSAIGIGTVAEVVGEGQRGSLAYRTFRVATLLASLAEPGVPLACELTAELAGLAHAPEQEAESVDGRPQPPPGARFVGVPPQPSLAVAGQWGGLPFVGEVMANLRRPRSQWLGVESWPPEAGTRLIDAIGECFEARGLPVRRLWMPSRAQGSEIARRLLGQMRDGPAGGRRSGDELLEALMEWASAGPAVFLAYGIDALDGLRSALGDEALARLQGVPLAIVAGAMHRTGAPRTVVRLLGSRPAGSPFVRVLRMQVPEERKTSVQGMRPDVQAVLDAVSPEARAVARAASDPACAEIDAIASALDMPRDAVIEHCRELETSGLVSIREGRLEFRDETTATAVRATQA